MKALINNLQADIALMQKHLDRHAGAGFHDLERMLEALCIPLFRAWKKCELQNMNQIRVNYPAIDLADDSERIAVQVTKTATASKINQTITVYEEKKFQTQYDSLYILGFNKAALKTSVPAYCRVIGIDTIINDLYDRADEDDIQEVLDAVRRHGSYSSLHPWDDRDCLEIVINYVDRNAIKHLMGVEGSAPEMVKGLNEISELIGKGQVNRRVKSKSIEEFQDQQIIAYLRQIKDLTSEIVAIVNKCRFEGSDFANLGWQEKEQIDALKIKIAEATNAIANSYHIPVSISLKGRW